MAMIAVGGVNLPEPSEYNVSLSDLDSENTTRNAKGVLIRDRVRAGVYKIDIGWEGLTRAQLQTITSAVSAAKLSVSFFDPTTGTANVTRTMYVGDRSGSLQSHLSEANRGASKWDLSFALVEY
jgi:hypothetical protein